MLRKDRRLSHTAFRAPASSRRRFRFGSVSFYPKEHGAAVVVSKKVCRSAVDRNRLRRRVRHILAGVVNTEGLVVFPSREALVAPHRELKEALEQALVTR